MNILALDPGTTTGWAALVHGKIISGAWWLQPTRGESPGMRYIKLLGCLNEVQCATAPELVVYEKQRHRGGAATQVALGVVSKN